ncbi:MAG: nitrate/sulfonate/bicarbonate ABC transporter ATP-binding protein [Bacteroidetes bacterium]|nr:nitrate/sulfonate/bicarbonate ABC transporter ATP-binding protein [Bacteroidota bacterium]
MKKNASLVDVKKVSQIYGKDQKKFTALSDIELKINPGEFVALVGPSGCGKSTLLRIITGLQKASKGSVLYNGEKLEGVNPNATIVFQTFALFPWFNVIENVELALANRDIPAKMKTARAIEAIDRVGMDGYEMAYPRELSGGMRQKVGFARAIVAEPELLCLDEPFSALDVLSAETLRGELLELWTEGKLPTQAILMVTHNIEEAVLMADRIVVMDKNPGQIINEMVVSMTHPRNRKNAEFQHMVDQVYSVLAGQTQPEYLEYGTAPGEPGITRKLPNIPLANISSILENLIDMPGKNSDIYKLADELGLESDELLEVTEAAELLGFVTITSGDISVTPLGETYAEASITARKEIFASRVKRIPIFKWLLNMLKRAANHEIERNILLSALELEFLPQEAEDQIDILMNWGRYAEIFVYDDQSESIFLEN